jgi:hypothetical protein
LAGTLRVLITSFGQTWAAKRIAVAAGGNWLQKGCNSLIQKENGKNSPRGCGQESAWEISINTL